VVVALAAGDAHACAALPDGRLRCWGANAAGQLGDGSTKDLGMNTTESRTFAAHLADLLRNEQQAMADFLVALTEFDRQHCWLELGYSGLFPFLNRQLGLSKAASFFRKTAAELIQRYPELVEPLRDGRLCLSTMASLAKVLTPENRADVRRRAGP
jgi:hypothetical protein